MADVAFMAGWDQVAQTAITAAAAYALLVVLLRVSGKRTLTQLSIFDFVVTVALGSMFASIALRNGPSLAQGVAAIGVTVALQEIVAWAARTRRIARLITSEPALLLLDGEILPHVARRNRLGQEAIEQAVRSAGHADSTQVHAVVLETNGKFSVIGSRPASPGPAYRTLLQRHGIGA